MDSSRHSSSLLRRDSVASFTGCEEDSDSTCGFASCVICLLLTIVPQLVPGPAIVRVAAEPLAASRAGVEPCAVECPPTPRLPMNRHFHWLLQPEGWRASPGPPPRPAPSRPVPRLARA